MEYLRLTGEIWISCYFFPELARSNLNTYLNYLYFNCRGKAIFNLKRVFDFDLVLVHFKSMNIWDSANLIIPGNCSWLLRVRRQQGRKDVFSSYVDGAMTQCPRNVSHVTWRAWARRLGRKALNWHYELGLDVAIVIVDQVATRRTRVSTSALVKTQTQIRTWSSQDQSS